MPKPIEMCETNEKPARPPLTSIERSLLEAEVIEQLRTVYDPELPVNIYDLGLIYDIKVAANRDVIVVMTLTSPMCPVAGSLPGEVEVAVRETTGIGSVNVELTWEPPFTVEMIPEETRLMLGF